MTEISGIWLPIIKPFVGGAVDLAGYERLLAHYLARGVTGIFPLGTTGESPTLDEDEMEAIVDRTVAVVAGRVPIFVGIGGNATAKVLKTLARLERYPFAGIVSVCPYYNRPSQDGLRAHFTRIADEHLSGARDHGTPIWTLLMFDAFLRNVMAGTTQSAPLTKAA